MGIHPQGSGLDIIEQTRAHNLDSSTTHSGPSREFLVEGAVFHHFGIQATISGMVDFLEEESILIGADLGSALGCIDVHRDLGRK